MEMEHNVLSENGRVERREALDGVKADLLSVVDEQMKVDSDGDGLLSLAEYALAVPDPHSEKTASGLTRRQEIMFRSADTNKDSKYSREESLATNSYRWTHSYRGRHAAYSIMTATTRFTFSSSTRTNKSTCATAGATPRMAARTSISTRSNLPCGTG
jgi:hypothetical protein